MLPIEKNGTVIFGKTEDDGTKYVEIYYKGFKTEFEGKSDLSNAEIEAFKNGVLTATEKIFNMLPDLDEKRGGSIKNILFEDLFPQNDILNQHLIPKRNRQGFLVDKTYPCSLPKSENGKIIVIAMNSNGEYVKIPINSDDFSFHFNEDNNRKHEYDFSS